MVKVPRSIYYTLSWWEGIYDKGHFSYGRQQTRLDRQAIFFFLLLLLLVLVVVVVVVVVVFSSVQTEIVVPDWFYDQLFSVHWQNAVGNRQ